MATTKPKLAGLPDDQVIQSAESSAVKADAAAAVDRASRQIDAFDKAHELTAKLEALLNMTCGEAGHLLRTMNPALQDAYMWACSDMATELKECVSALDAP